jgi:oligoribonuclease
MKESNRLLVWADMEAGGLNKILEDGTPGAAHYPIFEIAVIVTDIDLNLLPFEPLRLVLQITEEDEQRCDPVALEMHRKSSLLDECRKSTLSVKNAEHLVLEHLKEVGVQEFNRKNPYMNGMLSGNSIKYDRDFIQMQMPRLDQYLHYQMLDVSMIKYAFIGIQPPKKQYDHRALNDIMESIDELRFYRRQVHLLSQD